MTRTTGRTPTLEQLLEQARRRVEVEDQELQEARRRRDLVAAALRREFPGSRVYVNGSIAHGDALTPLTDVDLGVVVAEAESHGPGKRGPRDLKMRAAEAVRRALKADFPKLAVEVEDRKRSVLIRFRDPVTRGQDDFTADIIVAVDNVGQAGLFIPRFDAWDRAHPEEHTRLVRDAIDKTEVVFARVVRLLKHWNRSNGKPLCSWNIKALALGCLSSPTTLVVGLRDWLTHAIAELSVGETADPAGVAEKPIKLNETRRQVLNRLREASGRLDRAVAFEAAGYPVLAWEELALMFNDESMLPRPAENEVLSEQGRKVKDDMAAAERRTGSPALLTGVGAGALDERRDVRSWAP